MADVNQLRISSPAIARCYSGCHLFESHHALLRADRFNIPIVVRINQHTWADSTSAPSSKTEPVRRIVFNNLTVHPGNRGLLRDRDILRQVFTNPSELATFL